MERRFGSAAPLTTGVKEEFQLVEPDARESVPAMEAVIDASPDGSGRVGREPFRDFVGLRAPMFCETDTPQEPEG